MKPKSLKIKVGTILDRELYFQVKAQAAMQAKSVSDVMDEALRKYTQSLRRDGEDAAMRVKRLCSNPALKATEKEIREIEALDIFER